MEEDLGAGMLVKNLYWEYILAIENLKLTLFLVMLDIQGYCGQIITYLHVSIIISVKLSLFVYRKIICVNMDYGIIVLTILHNQNSPHQ